MAEQKLKPGGIVAINPGELPFSPIEAEAAAYLQNKVGAIFFPKRPLQTPPLQSLDLSFYDGTAHEARHSLKGLDFYLRKIPVGDQFCQPGNNCAYADKLRDQARREIEKDLKGKPILPVVIDLYTYRNQFTRNNMSTVILFLSNLADFTWEKAEPKLTDHFLVVDPPLSPQRLPEIIPNHKEVHLAIALSTAIERLTSLLRGGADFDNKTFIEPYGKLRSYEGIYDDGRAPQKGRLDVVHEYEDVILDLFRKFA